MTKQVEITNRDGHILRGIVNIPEDGTRFPAIVNVHGFTGNKSGYKSIYTHTARLLAEHGFASVRFDLYGNGESDGEFEDMTFTGALLSLNFLGVTNSGTGIIEIFQYSSANLIYLISIIFTIIYTVRIYSYLHNKRKADLYGSLPIGRSTLFVTKTASAYRTRLR